MTTAKLSMTRWFDALADEYRRRSLSILAQEGTLDITDLASRIAAGIDSKHLDERADERIKQIKISLRHVHLPKLEDAGLIVFGHDSTAIRVREDAREEVTKLSKHIDRVQRQAEGSEDGNRLE